MQQDKLLANNNVLWMGVVSFFTDFASSLVMPILPIFVVLVLDQGVDKFGLVVATTTLVSYLLRFVGGALSDRYQNNKVFLLLGYGLSALAKPFLTFSGSWIDVAAIRSSERLGKALRAAPKDKLLSSSVRRDAIGRGIGLHKAIEKSGELLGLVCLLAVIHYLGSSEAVFRGIFSASLIPGILALVVLAGLVKETATQASTDKKSAFSFVIEPQLKRPIVAYSLLCLFMFNEAFFILAGNNLGITLPTILSIYIVSRAIQIIVSLKIGALIDASSVQRLLTVGYCAGLGALLLLLVGNMPSFVIAFVLLGIYELITLNTIRSYIGRHAIDKGATFGALYFLVAIASAFGAYWLGIVWQFWGLGASIVISTLGVVASGILIVWLLKTGVKSSNDIKLSN